MIHVEHQHDLKAVEAARRRHKNSPKTKVRLFRPDGRTVQLDGLFAGRGMLLIGGGPSAGRLLPERLSTRGVLSMAVNNVASIVRPNLWVSVDDPGNFCDAIWRDPGILKFIPMSQMRKAIWVRGAKNQLVPSGESAAQMPGVFGFRRNEKFVAKTWLNEPSFCWGNHAKVRDSDQLIGSRSVFLVAIKLAHYLGIRRLYLLGCDFHMPEKGPAYAFAQNRSPGSVRGNNRTYKVTNRRLERLVSYFHKEDFHVFNCTPGSGLTAFPFKPFGEALRELLDAMPSEITTEGMYDHTARRKG